MTGPAGGGGPARNYPGPVVRPSLRAGLELPLPPLPDGPDAQPDLAARLGTLAARAAGAGFTIVWLSPGPGRPPADPVVAAASVASDRSPAAGVPALVGVVADVGSGRAPAIVARDVTALDHVSGGRAALLLQGPPELALAALTEAAAICRALFVTGEASLAGAHFGVAGAVNRPAPLRHGGPPLVVSLPPGGGDDPGALAGVSPLVDAVSVGGDPGSVGRVRAMLQAESPRASLLWRGTLPPEPAAARSLVAELAAAGAEGAVVVAGGWPDDASLRHWADALRPLAGPRPA